ncbi:class I SAM-dependent methyltransferase [bacterium]|nr:class I SAM-dependent methyltransferase [bacterium]
MGDKLGHSTGLGNKTVKLQNFAMKSNNITHPIIKKFHNFTPTQINTTMITHCDICGKKLKTIKKLHFKYIIGMADNYTQHVKICPDCKLIVTGNPFSEEKLNNRYKKQSKYEFDDINSIPSDDYKQRCARQRNFIEENNVQFSSILEIGASSGYNLSLYSDKKTLGIEPSRNNCENAKKNYNVDMFCGVFKEYYSKHIGIETKENYDMVFLSHTLEHIVSPCSFIKECVQVISPRYFFIEVPTFDFKFNNQAYGMYCDEHVNCFTLESLENMMSVCGYRLLNAGLDLCSSRVAAGCPAVFTLWEQTSSTQIHQYVNSVPFIVKTYNQKSKAELNRIRKIIKNIKGDKIAVWGTGNHLSLLLATTPLLKKNIVKFYDSDTKKQAFQIAGIPIQAFNPQDIENRTIDTILLASYVAQNQMLRILEPYKDKCRIVTLYDC